MENVCLKFVDRLLNSPSADPEMASHVAQCSRCTAAQAAACAIRQQKTMLALPPDNFVKKVMDNLPPAPGPTAGSSHGGWQSGVSSVLSICLSNFILIGSVVLFFVIIGGFVANSTFLTSVKDTGPSWSNLPTLAENNGKINAVPWLATSSSGISARFILPSTFGETTDGLKMKNGKIVFDIPASSPVFFLETPHQQIRSRFAKFTVEVLADETLVTVESGQVEIVSNNGIHSILQKKPEVVEASSLPRLGVSPVSIPDAESPPDAWKREER